MYILVDDALIDIRDVKRVHIEEATLRDATKYGIFVTYTYDVERRRVELIKVCDTKEQADAILRNLARKLGAVEI